MVAKNIFAKTIFCMGDKYLIKRKERKLATQLPPPGKTLPLRKYDIKKKW